MRIGVIVLLGLCVSGSAAAQLASGACERIQQADGRIAARRATIEHLLMAYTEGHPEIMLQRKALSSLEASRAADFSAAGTRGLSCSPAAQPAAPRELSADKAGVGAATVATSPIPDLVVPATAPVATNKNLPQTPTQNSLAPTNAPPLVDPVREATERLDKEVGTLYAHYVAAFRPGEYLDDPIPQFALTIYRHHADVKDIDIAAEYAQHLQSPADAWSLEMESLLRRFFESQSDMSAVHVGLSCRTAQCVLQIGRRSNEGVSLESTFFNRLRQEAWFSENLVFRQSRGGFRHGMMTLGRRPRTGN